MDKFSKLFGT